MGKKNLPAPPPRLSAYTDIFSNDTAQKFAEEVGISFYSLMAFKLNDAADRYLKLKHYSQTTSTPAQVRSVLENVRDTATALEDALSRCGLTETYHLSMMHQKLVGQPIRDFLERAQQDTQILKNISSQGLKESVAPGEAPPVDEWKGVANRKPVYAALSPIIVTHLAPIYSTSTGERANVGIKHSRDPDQYHGRFFDFVDSFLKNVDPASSSITNQALGKHITRVLGATSR